MDFKKAVLDHVAIVVEDLDQSQKIYENLGFEFGPEREIVEEQGVMTAFAQIDEHSHIELLMPHGKPGAIHSYLKKKGPGIHHLCFKVDDIEKKSKELRDKGMTLIYPVPQKGAGGALVNFIHPKSCGGVLIEISCRASE